MTLLTDAQYLTLHFSLLKRQVVIHSLLGAALGLANHRCAAHHAAQLHSAEQYMIKSHSMRAYLQKQRSYLRDAVGNCWQW